jgi:hypothetical protein
MTVDWFLKDKLCKNSSEFFSSSEYANWENLNQLRLKLDILLQSVVADAFFYRLKCSCSGWFSDSYLENFDQEIPQSNDIACSNCLLILGKERNLIAFQVADGIIKELFSHWDLSYTLPARNLDLRKLESTELSTNLPFTYYISRKKNLNSFYNKRVQWNRKSPRTRKLSRRLKKPKLRRLREFKKRTFRKK